jgi:Enoyl-CoA hydratase/isomerase
VMPDHGSAPVQVTADGAIAQIILNRPAKRNAVSPEMAEGLEAALDRLEADPDLRVGVVSGAGRTLEAIPTPGHTRGHLLADYLRSLRLVRERRDHDARLAECAQATTSGAATALEVAAEVRDGVTGYGPR